MKDLQIECNSQVKQVFDNYPDSVRNKIFVLRELIFEAAREMDVFTNIEETLKWGEPSYLTKHGSTIRIGWKQKTPDQYAMYFKCTSRLVTVFRTIYNKRLNFEGNRAIVFQLNDKIPHEDLKHCIKAALSYHKVKHLPTLGI